MPTEIEREKQQQREVAFVVDLLTFLWKRRMDRRSPKATPAGSTARSHPSATSSPIASLRPHPAHPPCSRARR
eukprot:2775069-Rhodomonas_salina.1